MRRVLLFIPMSILISCGEDEPEYVFEKPIEWSQEQSSDMNQVFTEEEEDEINLFLERHQDWKMSKTETGLRYFIYEKSESNDTAKVYDIVTVDFELSLLDGTVCYSSKEHGPESFIVEHADIESGLHEAMKLMCKGDKGKFILPSRLAHGLIGDTEKVPPLTPVIYDIHLIEIERQ